MTASRLWNLYPGLPYVSPAWPTRDRIIPWGLFAIAASHVARVLALHRLNTGEAHAYGLAIAHTKDAGLLASITDGLKAQAYPEER